MVHVQKGDSARGEKDTKIVRLVKNKIKLNRFFRFLGSS